MAPWRYSDSYPVFDVFQTRILLEGEIARLSAGRLTQLQLDRMEEATRTMEECWASQDLLTNVEADLEFHGTIVSACSNAMLKALYQTVRDQVTETQRQPIPITDPERMRQSIAEHRRIIAALRANDAQGAKHEMETHIRNTARCAGLSP
jgi:GntR family transcriptional repressor for pyruvate dehydrogenase complex